jgi:hypothetical protein
MDEASKLLEAAHAKETQALRRDRDAAAAAMASHQARAHELERKLLEAQLSKQVGALGLEALRGRSSGHESARVSNEILPIVKISSPLS